jgi:hypothetical protein
MSEPVIIEWEQSHMGAILLDVWFARVTVPVRTEIFAAVGKSIQGQWHATVTPKGRNGRVPYIYVDYASPEKARKQVEHWAQYHWRTVPVWVPPDHRGAW